MKPNKENIFYISPKDWILFREKLEFFFQKENTKTYCSNQQIKYQIIGSFYKGYKIEINLDLYSATYSYYGIHKKPWEYLTNGIKKLLDQYIPDAKFDFYPFARINRLHSEIVYCPLIKVKNE